jgi:hypothetical protein
MGALALFFWLCAGGKEATPSLYVLTYRQNLFVVSFRLPFTRIYVVRVGAGGEVSDEYSKSYVGSSISADDVSDEAWSRVNFFSTSRPTDLVTRFNEIMMI